MTKLGNINFKDYDSDDTIRSSKYTSPSINKNRFKTPVFEKCKTKLKKNKRYQCFSNNTTSNDNSNNK